MLIKGFSTKRRFCQNPASVTPFSSGFRRADALAVLGAVGTAIFTQKLRKRARSRQRQKTAHGSHVSTQLNASTSQGADEQWEFHSASQPRNNPNLEYIPLLEETLPLSTRDLWDLIFASEFQHDFHALVNDKDSQIGDWHLQGGEVVRNNQYIHPVKKNAVGPSEAFTEEEWQCLARGDAGFVIEVQAHTREVPYGKNFHVQLKWTATRQSGTTTKLVIVGGVAFSKKLLLGSFIRKAAHEGLIKGYQEYRDFLLSRISNKGDRIALAANGEQPSLRRMNSSQVLKAAVDDLVKDGVFVSWFTILKAMLVLWCLQILIRLSNSQNGRLLASTF